MVLFYYAIRRQNAVSSRSFHSSCQVQTIGVGNPEGDYASPSPSAAAAYSLMNDWQGSRTNEVPIIDSYAASHYRLAIADPPASHSDIRYARRNIGL